MHPSFSVRCRTVYTPESSKLTTVWKLTAEHCRHHLPIFIITINIIIIMHQQQQQQLDQRCLRQEGRSAPVLGAKHSGVRRPILMSIMLLW